MENSVDVTKMFKIEESSPVSKKSSEIAQSQFYQNLPTLFDEAPKVYYGDIHQNIFPCDECPKSYNQIDNLRRHQRTHSGLKLLNCRFCERKFHRADGLKGHTLNMHKDQEDYQRAFYCGKCQVSFSTHWELTKHINSTHEDNNRIRRRTKSKLINVDSKVDVTIGATIGSPFEGEATFGLIPDVKPITNAPPTFNPQLFKSQTSHNANGGTPFLGTSISLPRLQAGASIAPRSTTPLTAVGASISASSTPPLKMSASIAASSSITSLSASASDGSSSTYGTPSSQRTRVSPSSSKTPLFERVQIPVSPLPTAPSTVLPAGPSNPLPAAASTMSSSHNFPMRAQYLSYQNQPQSAPRLPQYIFGFPHLPPFPKESLLHLPERPPISFPAWHPKAYRN